MSLRIFHTGDLHIGLRYTRYPERVRERLTEARIQVLEQMVNKANEAEAALFVIAGDLFDHHNVAARTVQRVQKILDTFAGALVLVLPGNHDFQDGMQNLWTNLQQSDTGKIMVLDTMAPVNLEYYGVPAVIYPCPCDRKHSDQNNLGWIRKLSSRPDARWHIGLAHGALQGLSPDPDMQYFTMSIQELKACNLDLWLLGHTHIPYPSGDTVQGEQIFNAGTPEPDGMDCQHEGSAWLIEINEEKQVTARRVPTGQYRFRDVAEVLHGEEDLAALVSSYTQDKAENTLVRLSLSGSLEQEVRQQLQETLDQIQQALLYLTYDDSLLMTRVTPELIQQEFSEGSFPQRFLTTLQEQGHEQALQMAYELIREVKGP